MEQPGRQPDTPPENRPTPEYTRLMGLRPTAARAQILGEPPRTERMPDDRFAALLEEILVIGKDNVRDDIRRAVEERVVQANTAQRIRDLGRRLEMRVTDPAAPANPIAPAAVQPQPGADPLRDARDRVLPPVDNRDRVADSRNSAILATLSNGMLRLYRGEGMNRGLDVERQSHREALQTVLDRLRDMPIRELRTLTSRDNPRVNELATRYSFNDDHRNAITFVAFFIDRRSGDVNRMLQLRTPAQSMDNMTLNQFLLEAQHLTAFVGEFRESLNNDLRGLTPAQKRRQIGPAVRRATRIDLNRHMEGDSAFKRQLVQLGLRPEHERQFMEYYGFAMRQTAGSLRTYVPDSWRGTRDAELVEGFRTIIGRMNEYVQTNAVDYLKLFTHGAQTRDGVKYENILAEALAADMSVQDVVELYIGLQQALQTLYTVEEGGRLRPRQLPRDLNNVSATGGLMLQMKVLNLIADKNPDAGIAFRGFLAGEGASMLTGNSSMNIPEDMRLPFQETVSVLAEEAGANIFSQYVENVWELSLLITGSDWFPDLPGGIEPYVVAAAIHCKVFGIVGRIPAAIVRMYWAKQRLETQRRARQPLSRDGRALAEPSRMRSVARAYVPYLDRRDMNRLNGMMDRDDAIRAAIRSNPALSQLTLTEQHLDAIHDARAVADGGGSAQDIMTQLQTVTTSNGSTTTAFTEEQARAVAQMDNVVGAQGAARVRAQLGTAAAPAVDTTVDAADVQAEARAELARINVETADPTVVMRLARSLGVEIDARADANTQVNQARAGLNRIRGRR